MTLTKGPTFEELVRDYFAEQGFFVLRSVPYRYGNEDVTDIDAWLYSRNSTNIRSNAVVDIKNKKSPKAFERVLWVKGLQQITKCDRAIIATTDSSPSLARFATAHNVFVLSKAFLDSGGNPAQPTRRLTLEDFRTLLNTNTAHKQDGDWSRILGDVKSAVSSMVGFPAFNKSMHAFRFFAERAEVRLQHREVALRSALFTAALACIALDIGLERLIYSDEDQRFRSIFDGVAFGDTGDGKVKSNISDALNVLSEGLQNGRSIAAQADQQFQKRLESIRADVIAEHFMKHKNSQPLFNAAIELENASHTRDDLSSLSLSLEARSILGVFSDFVDVKRSALIFDQRSILFSAENKSVEFTELPIPPEDSPYHHIYNKTAINTTPQTSTDENNEANKNSIQPKLI